MPTAPTPPPFPAVTVLLGDPRLADATKIAGHFAEEDHEAFRRMKAALAELPGYRFRFLEDHDRMPGELAELAASAWAAEGAVGGTAERPFVLNFCDTGFRNEARLELHVAAYLEMLGLPFSGAGPACLALCYDKAAVRGVAAGLGVPVPEERFLAAGQPPETALPERYPVIVKPNRGDGSVGITRHAVARDRDHALAYLRELRRQDPRREVLVQEFLEGREYGIGLVGNPDPEAPDGGFTVLPPMEVDFGRLPAGYEPILSFESKADPDSPYYTDLVYRRAALSAERLAAMVTASRRLFERLGCRDYARFDFRAGADGVPRLLEVNPNPAWCWDGKLAHMASFDGLPYSALLGSFLAAAQARVAGGG